MGLARLDHRDVHAGVRDGGITAGDGLVAEPLDDELEERPDVVVGLADQDACHPPQDRSTAQGFRARMV